MHGKALCTQLAFRAIHWQSFPRATPPGVTVGMPAGLLTHGSMLHQVFPSRLGMTVTSSGVAHRSQLRVQSRSWCLIVAPHRVPFSFPFGKPTPPLNTESDCRSISLRRVSAIRCRCDTATRNPDIQARYAISRHCPLHWGHPKTACPEILTASQNPARNVRRFWQACGSGNRCNAPDT